MWANAQRFGRPAEYRWRPLRKFRIIAYGTPPAWLTLAGGVPRSNAANIGERKTLT